jgi:hypothetical protein
MFLCFTVRQLCSAVHTPYIYMETLYRAGLSSGQTTLQQEGSTRRSPACCTLAHTVMCCFAVCSQEHWAVLVPKQQAAAPPRATPAGLAAAAAAAQALPASQLARTGQEPAPATHASLPTTAAQWATSAALSLEVPSAARGLMLLVW